MLAPLKIFMREHGLLNRVLLIYDYCANRFHDRQEVDLKALSDARDIIKNFVEAYHEKLEEEHLFPRFEKAKVLTDLVVYSPATCRRACSDCGHRHGFEEERSRGSHDLSARIHSHV